MLNDVVDDFWITSDLREWILNHYKSMTLDRNMSNAIVCLLMNYSIHVGSDDQVQALYEYGIKRMELFEKSFIQDKSIKPRSVEFSLSISKVVDLIPVLRPSDFRIPRYSNANTYMAIQPMHGKPCMPWLKFNLMKCNKHRNLAAHVLKVK